MRRKDEILKPEGKLGILIPGLGGAVSTTLMAGVEAVRQNLSVPIGSLTQMGTIRLGKRFEYRVPRIKDFVPLAALDDLVFGGWDIFSVDCYAAALDAGVLKKEDLEKTKPFLQSIRPWPAAFNQRFEKNLSGPNIRPESTYPDIVEEIKTGQTLMKTILAPGLKARSLGLTGWYSTNILGNRDGLVLDAKDASKTKEESKRSALETILQPDVYPELYGEFHHKVVISYYPPRGDEKEGWDCIDISGWLGYPMQIKVNFLCRDSILAAPIVLDLVLFTDLAQRADMTGIQEWLSFYFKSPQCASDLYPEHDLFIQLAKLKNTLRYMMMEDQITHLGLDYYYEI